MSILFSEINQGIRGLDDSDLAYFSAASKRRTSAIPENYASGSSLI